MTSASDTLIPGLPPPWTKAASQRWLSLNPLPASFQHADRHGVVRPVQPSHAQDYGKWLAETPYFPGLFEEIHDILSIEARVDLDDKSTAWGDDPAACAAWMVGKLVEREKMRGEQAALPLGRAGR